MEKYDSNPMNEHLIPTQAQALIIEACYELIYRVEKATGTQPKAIFASPDVLEAFHWMPQNADFLQYMPDRGKFPSAEFSAFIEAELDRIIHAQNQALESWIMQTMEKESQGFTARAIADPNGERLWLKDNGYHLRYSTANNDVTLMHGAEAISILHIDTPAFKSDQGDRF